MEVERTGVANVVIVVLLYTLSKDYASLGRSRAPHSPLTTRESKKGTI